MNRFEVYLNGFHMMTQTGAHLTLASVLAAAQERYARLGLSGEVKVMQVAYGRIYTNDQEGAFDYDY